jgi:hypothetical protein
MLIRVIAAVPELKAAESYFSHGCLFSFNWEGMPYRLYPEDITALLGLHLWNIPQNDFDRHNWLKNLSSNRLSAQMGCHPFGPSLNPVNSGEDWDEEDEDGFDITPGEEDLKAAAHLVDFVMGGIPDEVFTRFESENNAELNEIRALVHKANSPLPIQFDWNALPAETRQAFIRHILKENFREGISMEEIQKNWHHVEDLAHLVWASNNGLIFNLDILQLDPRWKVDFEKYQVLGDDSGFNFQDIWNAFNLDAIAHLIPSEMPKADLWDWGTYEEVYSSLCDLEDTEEEFPTGGQSSTKGRNQRRTEKETIRKRKERWQACLSQAEINAFTGPVSELRIPVNYHLQNLN